MCDKFEYTGIINIEKTHMQVECFRVREIRVANMANQGVLHTVRNVLEKHNSSPVKLLNNNCVCCVCVHL